MRAEPEKEKANSKKQQMAALEKEKKRVKIIEINPPIPSMTKGREISR